MTKCKRFQVNGSRWNLYLKTKRYDSPRDAMDSTMVSVHVTASSSSGRTGRYCLYEAHLYDDDYSMIGYDISEAVADAEEVAAAVMAKAEEMIKAGGDLLDVLVGFCPRPFWEYTSTTTPEFEAAMADRIVRQIWYVHLPGATSKEVYAAMADRAEEMGLSSLSAYWRLYTK